MSSRFDLGSRAVGQEHHRRDGPTADPQGCWGKRLKRYPCPASVRYAGKRWIEGIKAARELLLASIRFRHRLHHNWSVPARAENAGRPMLCLDASRQATRRDGLRLLLRCQSRFFGLRRAECAVIQVNAASQYRLFVELLHGIAGIPPHESEIGPDSPS